MKSSGYTFVCWIFKKLSLELPYDPVIPLLGIHTEEARIERDTCTPVFIAALFIIARTWKQLRCPSADKWIRKLWYIYKMEYYSAIKKNTFESVLMRWIKLEPIIQSEVIQKEKHQYSILMHIWALVAQRVKSSACNAGDPGLISRLERSPGEENGNPLQYCCLENPMDGKAW